MRQRDMVLVPFPFSDQSGQKIRPALIISNDQFNQTSDDFMVCAITTNIKDIKYSTIIDSNDLEEGILHERSAVKSESIFKVQKTFIIKKIATLSKPKFLKLVEVISDLIKPTN